MPLQLNFQLNPVVPPTNTFNGQPSMPLSTSFLIGATVVPNP